jgi:hypothetical protein
MNATGGSDAAATQLVLTALQSVDSINSSKPHHTTHNPPAASLPAL